MENYKLSTLIWWGGSNFAVTKVKNGEIAKIFKTILFSSENPQSSKVDWKFLHSNDKFYEWLIQISTCPLNIAVVNQSISCECNFRFDTLGINTKY